MLYGERVLVVNNCIKHLNYANREVGLIPRYREISTLYHEPQSGSKVVDPIFSIATLTYGSSRYDTISLSTTQKNLVPSVTKES